MPSCAATRRASSTSAALQHPESLSPPHNFSVTPVTSCPSAWSTAAATEESTPPLIITSTRLIFARSRPYGPGRSGPARCSAGYPPPDPRSRGGPDETVHGLGNDRERDVDVGGGRRVAEAEADRRAGPLRGEAHREQHVRGVDGTRGARGARRRVHLLLIERDEQRLRLNSRKRAVEDSLDSMQRVAVELQSRNRARQAGLQPV